MTAGIRPGDVVLYQPDNRWCHDGWAIAEQRDYGVVLVDTYWITGANVLSEKEELTAEVQFNLADYEAKTPDAWKKYAPSDRRYIPKHGGYQTVHLVRKGSSPDLTTQIENAREAVREAEDKLDSAKRWLDWRRQELAELEARAVTA